MGIWVLAWAIFNALLISTYTLCWRKRRIVAAYVYIHKGAIWFTWITLWLFFLAHLAGRPVSHGFIHAAHSPIELAKAMLAILGTVLVIDLIYLYHLPVFRFVAASISKDSSRIDWQLDVDVEEMINAIVEESATTPLLLLNMALADLLTETPVGEWDDFLKNIWLNYVPVVTNSRARGAAFFRTEQPAASEEELNRIMRWAGEALKVTTNRDDPERKFNCAAFPLVLNGQAVMVVAAYWPKRHPLRISLIWWRNSSG